MTSVLLQDHSGVPLPTIHRNLTQSQNSTLTLLVPHAIHALLLEQRTSRLSASCWMRCYSSRHAQVPGQVLYHPKSCSNLLIKHIVSHVVVLLLSIRSALLDQTIVKHHCKILIWFSLSMALHLRILVDVRTVWALLL